MLKILSLLVIVGWIEDTEIAARDAASLDPTVAARTRYLTIANIPIKERAEIRTAISFWTNSLSRESKLVQPRQVSETVLALLIDDYGWNAKTYDALANEDPFFHVRVQVTIGTEANFWYPADGTNKAGYYPGKAAEAGEVVTLAPWLNTVSAAALVAACQSPAPISRADWWLSRVAIQADRKTGYYDFLGVKDRADFEKLVGLSVKESERLQKETAAIVSRSGVGNLPRQIFRYQSPTGAYYVTHDALDNSRDKLNAQRNFFADFKHQAEEHYATLPNGLYAFFLSDDKGVRQDSAPDKIGPDRTAPGNDARIHVGLSCVRCHVEGIRPINDWARKVFASTSPFTSPDPELTRRFQRVYLDELAELVSDDQAAYAKRLGRANGLKAEANAKAVANVWRNYIERDLMPIDSARELGLSEDVYLTRLREYYKAKAPADPVLAGHIAIPPVAIRSDDWEQLAPLVIPIVRPSK